MSEILTLVGLGAGFSVAVLAAVAWTIFWKGWSLWISARKGEFWWFIAMLIINTFGILEILYLFVFKKMKFNFKTKRFEERQVVKEVNNPQSAPSQNQD
jgi:hypothetical protein